MNKGLLSYSLYLQYISEHLIQFNVSFKFKFRILFLIKDSCYEYVAKYLSNRRTALFCTFIEET
jgi:hypothetical protein